MSQTQSSELASIWKKSAMEQSPVYEPVIVTVSPGSQYGEVPPPQFGEIEAEVNVHGGMVVVVVVEVEVDVVDVVEVVV
jgi:hypothetical protein